jgi:penicillin-binding protein 1A
MHLGPLSLCVKKANLSACFAGDLVITSKNNSLKPGSGWPRYLRWLVLATGLAVAATITVTAAVIGAYYYVAPELPPAETIREIPLQIPLRIYSRDGYLIEEVGERRRILVTYDDVPQHVIDSFVAAEDRRFFVHPGVDYQGILRAGLLLLRTGKISGGGSTLTQQLARDYFLTREQSFTRKLREAFLAYKIERAFTKQEIMALFLNKMFFGQRAYGVAAAAQVYFGKSLRDINVAEAATLAGVLPAPSKYNPVRSPANALMRRSYVLRRMHDLEFIDDTEYDEASNFAMESTLHGTANELVAPYVAEMVRREMLDRYGEATYSAGYEVFTTLDSSMQRAATYSLRNGLLEFTRRRGYHGAIANALTDFELDPGVLQTPYPDWPEELQVALSNYRSPASLVVAIVTALNDDNSADIVLQDGATVVLPWHGISWAKPFVDWETTGPAPETAAEVLQPGDFIYVMPISIGGYALAQLPKAQSGFVSVDPNDGAITSLSGGYDFSISKFNRVTQAIRQPGSSFKPFIYAAALQAGNTLATIVLDAPVVINSAALERLWRPINYSGRFYGPQRVREGLVKSMNLLSVRLLLNKTGVGNTVRFLAPFGFNDSALPRNGSLALGGGNATPLDMAQAYASIANGGYAITPYVIDSIIDVENNILYRANPPVVCRECEPGEKQQGSVQTPIARNPLFDADSSGTNAAPESVLRKLFPGLSSEDLSVEQFTALAESYRPDATTAPGLFENINAARRIMSPQIAYLIQDAMREVIRRGTGVRANRALRRRDLSGKTGTSNDGRDAWFAGFNRKVVAIVWVGYDDHTPLGPREEGSRTALPIWIEFMRAVILGTPLDQMPAPEGIVSVRINKFTGCPATLSDPYEDTMFEVFREEYVPECDAAEARPDIFNSADDYDQPMDNNPEEITEGEAAGNDTQDSAEESEDEEPLF